MSGASLIWGSPSWGWVAVALGLLGCAALLWAYWRAPAALAVRYGAAGLKALTLAALAFSLVGLAAGLGTERGQRHA